MYGVVEFVIGKEANVFEFKTDNLNEAIAYAKEGASFGTIHLVKNISLDEIVYEARPNA